jgi:hypothetical protein
MTLYLSVKRGESNTNAQKGGAMTYMTNQESASTAVEEPDPMLQTPARAGLVTLRSHQKKCSDLSSPAACQQKMSATDSQRKFRNE